MKNIYQAKGETIEEQYFDVGELYGPEIRASVAELKRRWGKQARIRKSVAERSLTHLQSKQMASEFIRCITAWANGAKISVKQAMWLMADNLSGCQTMMIRYGSGVALLHTEEDYVDMASHMTGEQVVMIGDSRCIVYNDLMPGAGLYGWKAGLLVGVDTLFLREDGIEEVETPLLANVVAWMVWRMSPEEASPERVRAIATNLGVLIDGYAINVVRRVGSEIGGYKITLARDETKVENLGEQVGDYLRQVNIVEPNYKAMRWAAEPRKIWRGGYKHFLERLERIDSDIAKYGYLAKEKLSKESTATTHLLIQRSIYTDLAEAYINSNVGAVCLGMVDEHGTSVSCKLNDQKPFEGIEYLDLL